MAAISGQLNKIRIEAPGIPEPVLADALSDALADFFMESEAWRYTVPSLLNWTTAQTFPTLAAGTEIPAGTRVKRVDVVKYASDGTNLKEVPFSTRQTLDGEYPDWEVRTGNSPQRWTNDNYGDAPRIIPIATADVNSSLQVRVILVPTDSLTDLPDFLYYEFDDAFKYGALERILRMPGKDWTNNALSAQYGMMFREEIKQARSRVNAEFGQPNSRIMAYGGI